MCSNVSGLVGRICDKLLEYCNIICYNNNYNEECCLECLEDNNYNNSLCLSVPVITNNTDSNSAIKTMDMIIFFMFIGLVIYCMCVCIKTKMVSRITTRRLNYNYPPTYTSTYTPNPSFNYLQNDNTNHYLPKYDDLMINIDNGVNTQHHILHLPMPPPYNNNNNNWPNPSINPRLESQV